MLYACDLKWWDEYRPKFPGEKWSCDVAAAKVHGLEWIEGVNEAGLSRRQDRIHTGGNSGYQSVGLARNWGAARIVLLGFDMQPSKGAAHWHKDHPARLGNAGPYARWVERFRPLARDLVDDGVLTINASRATALDCFEKADISTALTGAKPAERALPIVVVGMHGLGDNLHQRSVVRHMVMTREVWLETPWPCVYHDLVGERLKLTSRGSTLRTQAKNAAREAGKFERSRVPRGTQVLQVSYPPQMVRDHGSVLGAMSAQCGVPVGDFRLPVPQEWMDKAERLLHKWKPDRPLMIYRPLMDRSEWGGCKARNPDQKAYRELFESIRKDFFVLSLADLVPGKEWLVEEPAKADVILHGGELDFETMAALTKEAGLVFSSPGFAVILAQSVGTPVTCVFGGYENSSSFVGGAAFAPYLGIDPMSPCNCFSHKHACQKQIDMPKALQSLKEFVNEHSRIAA